MKHSTSGGRGATIKRGYHSDFVSIILKRASIVLPVYSTLVDGFARDTGRRVHVQVAHRVGIGVGYPRHFSLAGAHVWRGNVDTWKEGSFNQNDVSAPKRDFRLTGPQEPFLGELNRKPPGHPLQLRVRINFGIDTQAGLSSAERHVHAGTFVGHQGCQSLDLVGAHVKGVTDAALTRGAMMGVLDGSRGYFERPFSFK